MSRVVHDPAPPDGKQVRPRKGVKRSRIRLVCKRGWVMFGERIKQIADQRRLTVEELGLVMGLKPTSLTKVAEGYVGIPRHALTGTFFKKGEWQKYQPWVERLRLKDAEAKEFEREAWLSLAPTQVIEMVRGMERRIADLEKQVGKVTPKARKLVPKSE